VAENGYGKPDKVFYANMLYAGLILRVDNGKLVARDRAGILTPILEAEIVKRKAHLIALLSPTPPPPLAPYFGRLISREEYIEAQAVAASTKVNIDAVSTAGKWVLFIREEPSHK
jgi:hypothetical protein